MTGIMGVNRVGLKRRPTFEEIITLKTLNLNILTDLISC